MIEASSQALKIPNILAINKKTESVRICLTPFWSANVTPLDLCALEFCLFDCLDRLPGDFELLVGPDDEHFHRGCVPLYFRYLTRGGLILGSINGDPQVLQVRARPLSD
jgi:hypothetical protein